MSEETSILQRDFFARPTLTVARELLGQRLVRCLAGQRLSGRIVETEAYIGRDDSACHASKGCTPRTEVMFGPPAFSYVYLVYGIHHMFNMVTEAEGFPAAVLIRAVEPLEGLEMMQAHRSRIKQAVNLTNGPGKLCQALHIERSLNRHDLTQGRELWLEADSPVADSDVATGPRIGINYARPQHRTAPWRFWVGANRFVSR